MNKCYLQGLVFMMICGFLLPARSQTATTESTAFHPFLNSTSALTDDTQNPAEEGGGSPFGERADRFFALIPYVGVMPAPDLPEGRHWDAYPVVTNSSDSNLFVTFIALDLKGQVMASLQHKLAGSASVAQTIPQLFPQFGPQQLGQLQSVLVEASGLFTAAVFYQTPDNLAAINLDVVPQYRDVFASSETAVFLTRDFNWWHGFSHFFNQPDSQAVWHFDGPTGSLRGDVAIGAENNQTDYLFQSLGAINDSFPQWAILSGQPRLSLQLVANTPLGSAATVVPLLRENDFQKTLFVPIGGGGFDWSEFTLANVSTDPANLQAQWITGAENPAPAGFSLDPQASVVGSFDAEQSFGTLAFEDGAADGGWLKITADQYLAGVLWKGDAAGSHVDSIPLMSNFDSGARLIGLLPCLTNEFLDGPPPERFTSVQLLNLGLAAEITLTHYDNEGNIIDSVVMGPLERDAAADFDVAQLLGYAPQCGMLEFEAAGKGRLIGAMTTFSMSETGEPRSGMLKFIPVKRPIRTQKPTPRRTNTRG